MRAAKKIKERSILQVFVSLLDDFPKARIIASESPDFVIKPTTKKTIGIELSNVLHNDNDHLIHHFLYQLNHISLKKFKNSLAGHIQFNKMMGHSDLRTLDTLLKKIIQCENKVSLASMLYEHPNIKRALIAETNPDFSMEWSVCHNHHKTHDIYATLENSIEEKNKKLISYRKKMLNEYWLLLHIDCKHCLGNLNLENFISKFRFESEFKKIYLLDIFNRKIFPIQH